MLKIFVCGKKYSGKSTVANYLVENHSNAMQFALANRLKRLLKILDVDINAAYDYAMTTILRLEGVGGFSQNPQLGKMVYDMLLQTQEIEDEPVKPRKRLQFLGTDCFRNKIDNDIWIHNLVSDINLIKNTLHPELDTIILDDVRFINEFKYLANAKFLPIVLRVSPEKQEERHLKLGYTSKLPKGSDQHPSETGVDDIIKMIEDTSIKDCIFDADKPLDEMLSEIRVFITSQTGILSKDQINVNI